MLPNAYEFHWDCGHIIFLGIFYGVLATVATALLIALFRWRRDLSQSRATAIEWEETFADLPQDRRHCRHEFDGKVTYRICDHGFDCETCQKHRSLAAAPALAVPNPAPPVGFELPPERLYHRGHTWIEPGPDGTLTVGLDEFAQRCLGRPERMRLPARGSTVAAGERCVSLGRGHLQARVAAPVGGLVVATGGLDDAWLYRLRPCGPAAKLDNLLQGDEAHIWMLRELEWLQRALSPQQEIPTLADGGLPVADLVAAYPEADWDAIWGQVCLES